VLSPTCPIERVALWPPLSNVLGIESRMGELQKPLICAAVHAECLCRGFFLFFQ